MKIDKNTVAVAASLFLIGQSLNKSTLNRSSKAEETRANTATLSILGPSGKTTLLPLTTVPFTSGSTVLDISVNVLKATGIPFEVGGSGKGTYITGIDNLSQLDEGPLSGWLFRIDDNYPSQGPAALTLTKDSTIQWVYTLNLGKDVGAPSGILQRKGNNFKA
ncbi:MAG: DUF4430 domain-containing protein [Cellulosilyticaceae bacterium]